LDKLAGSVTRFVAADEKRMYFPSLLIPTRVESALATAPLEFKLKQHESFVTALYTLMSDDGVHALGTEREYARLLRNMVIEYGVMFLTMLDKKGHTGRIGHWPSWVLIEGLSTDVL